MRNFGDSITVGIGASQASKSWASLLASVIGGNSINYAVSGGMVPDQATSVYGASINEGDFATMMIGTNDERIYGTNPAKQELFKSGLSALTAFIASNPVTARSAGAYSGSWSNTAVYGIGKASHTVGSKLSFSIAGPVIYIGHIKQANNNGQFTVKIDGVSQGTFSSNGNGINTYLGASYGPALLRFAGLTDTAHVVEIEVVAAASSSHPTYIDWWGGSTSKTPVFIGNIPYAVNYSGGGSEANVDAYNTDIAQIVSDLSSDGLPIKLVNVNSVLTPADMSDDYHPNDFGHSKIAAAFLSAKGDITYSEVKIFKGSDGNLYYGEEKTPFP